MNRKQLLLTALNTGPRFTPVQIQKLIFLLQKELPGFEQELFHFEPYNYGPFDKEIYNLLLELQLEGLVDIKYENTSQLRRYEITTQGREEALAMKNELDEPSIRTLEKQSKFVLESSFSKLVSSIYEKYPEMKVNSVFSGHLK